MLVFRDYSQTTGLQGRTAAASGSGVLSVQKQLNLGQRERLHLRFNSIDWMEDQASLSPLGETGCAQIHRFQRQAAGYRRKLVATPNTVLSKSSFEDSPNRWNK
jgi:hypothetical protein